MTIAIGTDGEAHDADRRVAEVGVVARDALRLGHARWATAA
jgi:hypothetical protein